MPSVPDYPEPWTVEPRADGFHVVALGDPTHPAFGPFVEPTAKLIAAAHPMHDALAAMSAAKTAAARSRAKRLADAALAQSEGR